MPFSRPNSPLHHGALRLNPGTEANSPIMEHTESYLLEQTFRLIPDVVTLYDVDSQQVVYTNRSPASILGYDDELITGDGLLHPDDVAKVEDQLQHTLALEDEESGDVAYRLKDASGNWRWFFERQVIFKRHVDGTPAQILKTARYEKESQTSLPFTPYNELLHQITEYNLPNFAFLIFDHDLRYTVATGILLRRLGLSNENLEGRTLRELLRPEIVDWLEPAYRAALTGTETHLEQVFDGMIVSVHCLPVRNEHGEVTAGIVLAEDITDDKQSTAALIESELRFAQFSENMQALFWMLDTERRRLLYLSPAFNDMWELTPQVAYEDPYVLLNMVHPDDHDMVRAAFQETTEHGHHDIKFRILLPSGKLRWLSSRAFPIYDDTGKLYRVAGIADDITEQMEIEKAAFDLALEREHMRLLSQFIGTTSHELRTPLTIINTSLYLMKKTNDPTKQGERLQIIEHQVAQLARLVGQMHMLLRVESLSDSPTTPVALNKVLAKLGEDYESAITKKELTLELAYEDNLPDMEVDPDLLLIALQNVLENAINYTDVGSIKAQTTVRDHEIILTVEDSGIGIDAEDLPHIFERFYKVEKNKRRNIIAAGLGLAITRRIMELSGGRIEVESQLEHGSSFRLIWPVKP